MLVQVSRQALQPARDRVESLREGREVAGKEQVQRVTDGFKGERAALPGADDVRVEDRSPNIVDLEVALDPGLVRKTRRIDRFDRRQVSAVCIKFAQDGVATPVAELAVGRVDTEICGDDRVVPDDTAKAVLGEVVEGVIEWPAVWCGAGPRELDPEVAAEAQRPAGTAAPATSAFCDTSSDGSERRFVSASAAAVASIAVSMSSAVRP